MAKRLYTVGMIKGGTGPTRLDHRDYDYHKTFNTKFGAIPFPPAYNTDAGLDMPNQDADNLPYGCTDETQSEIANDLGAGALTTALQLEAVTHANANGGCDVRTSLKAAITLNWITCFFNILAIRQDMFDAVRDAMISGGTEKRSVSAGSKWFPEFESVDTTGILPMPNFNGPNFTWHNWKICGWKTINDQVYLVGKTWQGPNYGDKGFCYISRPLFNQLMSVPGSVAFTASKGVMPPISTISVTWLEWIISYARQLLPYT